MSEVLVLQLRLVDVVLRLEMWRSNPEDFGEFKCAASLAVVSLFSALLYSSEPTATEIWS